MTTSERIELFTPAMLADPYPTYARLRREAPVHFDASSGEWVLSRFADVYGVLRDHATFSSDNRSWDGKGRPIGSSRSEPQVMLGNDPPRHTQFRGLMNRAFTPRRVTALEPPIQRVVDDLLAQLDGESVDAMESLAVPLPVIVIAQLMGVPVEMLGDFKRWSDAVCSTNSIPQSDRLAAMQAMMAYFAEAAADKRLAPSEDLVTALVEADIDGQSLKDAHVVNLCILLLTAGNETTTGLIGNLLYVLAERPDLWAQLRADRSLIEPAIEESLRRDSPLHTLSRFALRDVELHGVTIPAGAAVALLYASANRDEAEFPQPDEFRLDRQLNRHVAFGHGIHFCLGAPLARLEGRVLLNSLLDRYARIEPAGEPERNTDSAIFPGLRRLPLRLE